MQSELISLDEKREALRRILASRALGRSDQLRSFLRYICEAEFEGRAHQINEYVLGVSVLGRREDYNPAEDSCVRSRAYELRNKLRSYYEAEQPDDPVRIEIHKGGYVPRFERKNHDHLTTKADVLEPSLPIPPASPDHAPYLEPKPYLVRSITVLFLIVALVAAASLYRSHLIQGTSVAKSGDHPGMTPEMAAFWRPFLESTSPILVSFQIRLFFYSDSSGLVVRDFQTNDSADLPKSKRLAGFQQRMRAHDLRETSDYADFGAVHAVFLLGRLLNPYNKDILLKHSSSLDWEDISNNNVIFIGKPQLNPSIRNLLKNNDFIDDELGIIRNLHPLPGELAEYRSASTHGSGEKYALITLLPGPQPGRHILILDGSGAELMWALAEAITNPLYVDQILAKLHQPSGRYPEAFQVLVEATFESNVPVKIRYVTHRVSNIS